MANWITKVFFVISAFLITPILISGLGKYGYGVWVMVGEMIALLLIADFGIANSISRLVSKYEAREEAETVQQIVSTAFITLIGISIFLFFVVIVIGNSVDTLFQIESEYIRETKIIFIILGINLTLLLPLRISRGLLQVRHRFDLVDFTILAFKFLQLLVILLAAYYERISLLNLALIMASTNLLSEVVMCVIAKSYYKESMIGFRFYGRHTLRELMSLGGASMISSMSSAFSRQGMIFMVGVFLGVVYAPLFSIPLFILSSIGPIIGRIGTTFIPIASAYDSLSKNEELVSLSIYGARYSLMLGLFICSYVILFGEPLLRMWLPTPEITASDIQEIYSSLLILLPAFVLARSNQGNRVILLSTGNHWMVSSTLFLSSFISLFVGFFLLLYTELEVQGIAIAWALRLFLADYLLILFFTIMKYKIGIMRYFREAIFLPIAAIIPAFTAVFFYLSSVESLALSSLLIGSIIFTVLSFFCVYKICIVPGHIHILLGNK